MLVLVHHLFSKNQHLLFKLKIVDITCATCNEDGHCLILHSQPAHLLGPLLFQQERHARLP